MRLDSNENEALLSSRTLTKVMHLRFQLFVEDGVQIRLRPRIWNNAVKTN